MKQKIKNTLIDVVCGMGVALVLGGFFVWAIFA